MEGSPSETGTLGVSTTTPVHSKAVDIYNLTAPLARPVSVVPKFQNSSRLQ